MKSPAQLGAGVSARLPRVGLTDLVNHEMSWLVGYTYVGNGTLGATDSVYFVEPTVTDTVAGPANVPIAPADSLVGATYTADIIKHFARMRVRKCFLEVLSLNPSTSNSMVAVIAPSAQVTQIGAIHTNTTAAANYTDVISMDGATQLASWESGRMDMTPFVRGGSGPQQNEFAVDSSNANTTSLSTSPEPYQGIIPSTFVVSGNNSSSGLRGTKVHALIARLIVDLIDFVGGTVNTDPLGYQVRRARSVLGKREAKLSLLDVQRASRGGMLKFDKPIDDPVKTEESTGASDLDVLASTATKYGDRLQYLKRHLGEFTADEAKELLAMLAERL